MQITTITPEQKARFAEWRDRWIGIGLSTEPADFEKAEKAALKAYALCGLERPKIVLRVGSPYGAIMGGAAALLDIQGASGVDGSLSGVWQKIKQQIGKQVGLHARQQADLSVWQQVDHHVMQHVWYEISKQVDQQVERQVGQYVSQPVWWHVDWQVGQHVFGQVFLQVDEKVWQKLGHETTLDIAREGFNSCRGGAFLAAWCAYVTFLRDVLGLRDPALENFSVEEDLTTSCGWVWWHRDVLAIGDRPSEIHRDEQGRPHNEQGPSIVYRDGWKLYHIHGVAIPDFVIERPETITVGHIENEENTEVRRVMVARMGIERFIRESGLKPIHSDDFGTLYRREMPGDEPLVVVKVVNSTPEPDGSRKEYFLRVPPNISRAREAVAWTFGMGEKEYLPKVET